MTSKRKRGRIGAFSRRRPSPAMAVAIIALVFAMVGTAAATQALNHGGAQASKKKKKKSKPGPPGPQGPQGSPGLSGVHLVEVDSAFDTGTNPKVATANCAAGEVAISGGGQVFVSTATDTVALRTSSPVVGGDTQPSSGVPTGWRVNAVAVGSPGNWSDRAYAICAHTAG